MCHHSLLFTDMIFCVDMFLQYEINSFFHIYLETFCFTFFKTNFFKGCFYKTIFLSDLFSKLIHILLKIYTIYIILDIIFHIKCAIFAVYGPICVAIISLCLIVSDRLYVKYIFAVVILSVLKGDSENSKNFIAVNNLLYLMLSAVTS